MATAGPNSPGTLADAGGTETFSNPSNAGASDDSYATVVMSNDSRLLATNFGFSIPTGATIDGITVEVECKCSAGSTHSWGAGQLYNSGLIGTAISGLSLVGTSDAYLSKGGVSNLWGATLTPAIVNGSGFGVRCQFDAFGPATLSVDHIRMTVTYTESRPKTMTLLGIG